MVYDCNSLFELCQVLEWIARSRMHSGVNSEISRLVPYTAQWSLAVLSHRGVRHPQTLATFGRVPRACLHGVAQKNQSIKKRQQGATSTTKGRGGALDP